MKVFKKIIIVAGIATLVLLIWKLDPAVIWSLLQRVGWGFLLIVPMHGIDHIFNSLAWRFAFDKEHSAIPLTELYRVRIAGDGVNYLTPSATIAGEVIRPAMLGPKVDLKVAISSVVVAKFTQALAQVAFVMIGLGLIVKTKIAVIEGAQRIIRIGGTAILVVIAGVLLYAWFTRGQTDQGPADDDAASAWRISSLRRQIGIYFRANPSRFLLSVFFFTIGYLWGAVEVFLICYFLDTPVTVLMAIVIEILSTMIDGMAFMVPAKIGTQEAGKTAIFVGLGLPASQGLAFAIVRHVRELIWAGAGFVIYGIHERSQRKDPKAKKKPLPEAGALTP